MPSGKGPRANNTSFVSVFTPWYSKTPGFPAQAASTEILGMMNFAAFNLGALALEAGLDIEWKDVDFDGIIASLQSGQAEIAIAGLSPTEERKDMVDFGDIYYNTEAGLSNYFVFDSTENNIVSLEDLDGLIVGAQIGTVQAGLLEAIKDEYGFTVDLRNTNTMIVEEVKAGRVDVLVVESAIAISILEANTSLSKVGFESYLDDVLGSAIAFAKDSEYTAQFNTALATMKADGSLQTLIDKWFN